jgi:hypothetical protein
MVSGRRVAGTYTFSYVAKGHLRGRQTQQFISCKGLETSSFAEFLHEILLFVVQLTGKSSRLSLRHNEDVTFLVWKSGQQGLYLRMAFLAVIWCQDLQLDQNIFLGSDTFALGTVVNSSNLAVNQGKYVIALPLRLSWWDIWEICTDTRSYHMVVSTTTFVVGQQSESNIHLLQHYSYILTVNDQFEKPHKTNCFTKIRFVLKFRLSKAYKWKQNSYVQ